MRPDGTLVYNLDDPQVRRIAEQSGRRSLSYGMAAGRAQDRRVVDLPDRHTLAVLEWSGARYRIELPLLGGHYPLQSDRRARSASRWGSPWTISWPEPPASPLQDAG